MRTGALWENAQWGSAHGYMNEPSKVSHVRRGLLSPPRQGAQSQSESLATGSLRTNGLSPTVMT